MDAIAWPADWPEPARAAVVPHLGGEDRLRIVVGPPATSRDGSVLEGFVFLDDDGVPTIVHDRSGLPDVVPWPVLAGPVLRVYRLRARRPPEVLYAEPTWTPRHGR